MSASSNPFIQVASTTHPGLSRPINEDRFQVRSWHLPRRGRVPATLAVVSDGIGGNVAGEVAAEIVVDTVCQSLEACRGGNPLAEMRQSVIAAGRAVATRAQVDPLLSGMGATVALAWILGRRLYICSVGDSRVYLLRGTALRQLTTDHTFVQEAVDRGTLAAGEARDHPYGHVLRQHLGSPSNPDPDLRLRLAPRESDARARKNQGLGLQVGDTILLCTDGLSDLVPAPEIGTLLASPDLSSGLEQLVRAALTRGGSDNITAVALRLMAKGPSWLPGWLARLA